MKARFATLTLAGSLAGAALAISSWADEPPAVSQLVSSPMVEAGVDRPDHPAGRKLIASRVIDTPQGKDMRDLLEAQNRMRMFARVGALNWSGELANSSRALVGRVADSGCSAWAVETTLQEEETAHYWASSVRAVDGSTAPQDISARFVVSEWELGGRDYSAVDELCMRDDAMCSAYAHVVDPAASRVGCGHTVCANGAQVWVCKYDGRSVSELAGLDD